MSVLCRAVEGRDLRNSLLVRLEALSHLPGGVKPRHCLGSEVKTTDKGESEFSSPLSGKRQPLRCPFVASFRLLLVCLHKMFVWTGNNSIQTRYLMLSLFYFILLLLLSK